MAQDLKIRHGRNPLASWDDLVRWARRYGSASPRPPVVLPCQIVITAEPGSNGKRLVVRCRCMAGTIAPPAARFYAYDPLGVTADGLDGAWAIWREHRDRKDQQDAQV